MHRVLAILAVCFGAAGIVICFAVAIGVWLLASRLQRASETAFTAIDTAIAAVSDRTLQASEVVKESKLSIDEVRETLQNRALERAAGEIASRLDVERRSERLLTRLEQVDDGLELASTSIAGLQPAIELASSLGAPVDGSLVAPVTERITALRTQLQEATETVTQIRAATENLTSGDAPTDRFERVTQLALRAAVTLSELDSRLVSAAGVLADTQMRTQTLQSTVDSRIRLAEFLALTLAAWMAIGQVFLLRAGWHDCRLQRA